jgi:hypothetical protein
MSVTKKYYKTYLKKFISWKELKVKWEDENSFWIELYDIDSESKKKQPSFNKKEMTGKVRLRIDILSKEEADEAPLGAGRKEENRDPYLPPPEGRIEFSMNPMKMLRQLISPAYLKKCQKFFCCIICIAISAYCLPGLITTIFGNVISSIF